MYFLLGLLVAAVMSAPLYVRRRFVPAVFITVIGFFVFSFWFYMQTPNTGYVLWGLPGFLAVIGFFVLALIEMLFTWEEKNRWESLGLTMSAGSLVILLVVIISQMNFFRSDTKASLIGPMAKPVPWTEDLQPLDTKHIRLFKRENTLELAKSSLGQGGSIGSQYKLAENADTAQIYNKEIYIITPLDFQSQTTWESTKVVKHISLVHGENQSANPEIRELKSEYYLRYTLNACWEFNLERHLRTNGYSSYEFVKYGFQLEDDTERPWWVITAAKPAIGFNSFRLEKVLVVDPVSGAIQAYDIGQQPAWIDMVIPSSTLKENLDWWGEYHNGWSNAFDWFSGIGIGGARKDILESDEPNLIYGQSGDLEWVVNLTSKTATDTSLVYLAYCNGRTGQIRLLEAHGGKVDEKIISAVNTHPQVGTYKMHGASLQHTNVHGVFSAIVPLFSESHMYQGVAIVDVLNAQIIGVGRTLDEALSAYDLALAAPTQQGVVSSTNNLKTIEGVVELFQAEVVMGNTTYYLKIKDQPFLFTGNAGVSEKIRITREGHTVSVQFVDDGKDVVPIRAFDNLSVPLRSSINQEEERRKEQERKAAEAAKQQAEKKSQ